MKELLILLGGFVLLKSLNGKNRDELADDRLLLSSLRGLNPDFYLRTSTGLLTDSVASAAARTLSSSLYMYKTVFSQLRTQAQISQVAYWFKRLYGKSLSDYLSEKLDSDKLTDLFYTIQRLPDFTPKY